MVAARHAYPEYLELAAYACQPGRAFRGGTTRMGFYYDAAIQREIALIRHRRDHVTFSLENVSALRETADPVDAEVADLIQRMLAGNLRVHGQQYQVFLLSPPGDEQTLRLVQPVKNTTKDYKGKTRAWTMGQRYTQSAVLEQNPGTTNELEQLGG